MKSCSKRLGLARSLLALSVSFAVVLSTTALSFASRSAAGSASKSASSQDQSGSAQNELKITSVTATKTPTGVLLEWRTNSATDNVGFNIYRLKDGQRTKANREIIAGVMFGPGPPAMIRGGHSFGWLDREGTADSVYFIESVNLQGISKLHEASVPVVNQAGAGTQAPEALGAESANESERSYSQADGQQPNLPSGQLEDQFAIAAQTALKIAIKKDGWYRVTQPQMVAAGFNPTVDIRNLRLFGEATEVAISTSQSSGPFGATDYIEFYGRRMDTPTTDTRIYYLTAGTTQGKRVIGQNQTNDDPPPSVPPPPPPVSVATPTPAPVSPPVSSAPPVSLAPTAQGVLTNPIFYSALLRNSISIGCWGQRPDSASPEPYGPSPYASEAARRAQLERSAAAESTKASEPFATYSYQPKNNEATDAARETADTLAPVAAAETKTKDKQKTTEVARSAAASENPSVVRLPVAANDSPARTPVARSAATSQSRKGKTSRQRKRARRPMKQEHSHAVFSLAAAPSNFENVVERRDRGIYFVSVQNGEKENYFGQIIGSTPLSQTINTPNPDLAATGTAKLEIALQGASAGFHQINIEFNGVIVGQFSFNGIDPAFGGNPVQVFNIPLAQLHDGSNTIRYISPPGDLNCVDYVKLTYPHLFNADSGSLRFSLRGTATRKVDGFASRLVRLIDYTDPFNCIVIKPDAETSALGFAITVPLAPTLSKTQRLFYAIPQNSFDTPAQLSLNQPSTLNTGNLSATIPNGADFLVITHSAVMSSMTPLLNLRHSQGKIAAAVDIEDVFDEFSYGAHGPQAIKAFLSHATSNWVTKPRYVIFAGDASLDPRNYEGFGNLDFVPTKLVDATYNETASDDWLTDFDGDGTGDIPSGRLPVRTPAEANLIVSKIVNFSPATVPQSALLIADDPGTPPLFDFETGNDQVQGLLPAGMPVQRVNVRTTGSAASTDAINSGLTAGRSIVNYSGHGTLDSWASSVIFTAAQATALTQGTDKLPFVVVMDCLNGYFQAPNVLSLSEAFVKAPSGGAVAVFASSGLTTTPGQREMELELYRQLYGSQVIPVGDAIKIAKNASNDIDVRRTWILFGDPSMKMR